ncbi:TonB-dependent receptor family protein [Desulfatibacillum aliphaticivorans]|nr:TonB-dependent receptor [Desulfatibacillum aliphaticivorans]
MKRLNSMKIMIVGALAASLAFGPAYAQEEQPKKLEKMVVSAAKMETSVDKTPTNITVFTREEIEQMPKTTTINELLRQVPGLYIPQYQSGVANDGVYSARGAEPSTTGLRFLVNGIEFNKGNGYTVPTRIPINDIERIEVIKTASAEYGDQAIGGLINVVTRVSNKPLEAKAGVSVGDFNYENYYTVINGTRNKWEYFVDMSFSNSEGYQDEAYYDPENFYTRLAYNIDETSVCEFHGSHMASKGAWPKSLTQAQLDEDPTQSPGGSNEFENDYNLAALAYKKKFGDDELQVKVIGKDEWVWMDYGLDFEFDEWEIFPSVTYNLRHSIGSMKNSILFGVEGRKHELTTQLWTRKNNAKFKKTKHTLREDTSFALYIVDQCSITEDLTVTFGGRYDSFEQEQTGRVNPANSVDQSDEAFSPKIGATYTINQYANLFAGFNSGFKSPARVPGAAYSADLDPERTLSYEAGVRGFFNSWLSYTFCGFLNQYKDKWVKTGTAATDPYANSGSTETLGFEVSLQADHSCGLFGHVNYTWQEPEYDEFTEAGVVYDGKRFPKIPEQMLGVLLGYENKTAGQFSVTWDYVGERYFDQDNTLLGEDYLLVGAGYEKSFDNWQPGLSIFLSASNLTDENTAVYGSGTPGAESLVPVYGRRIFGGVELKFDFAPK